MFDLRYHVASLAAVFFALVIGILVGVALASHGLGNTERKRLEEDLRRAENQSDVQRGRADSLSQTGSADHAYVDATYKSVVANRLKGKRVAVLFVGSSSDDRRSKITQALADANAGPTLRFTAVQVPGDPSPPEKSLAQKPVPPHYARPAPAIHGGQGPGRSELAREVAREEAVPRALRRSGSAQEPRTSPGTGVRRREGHAVVERTAESDRRGDDRAVEETG